ncbi:MAG: hypothetical protein ABI723_08045 [Bacteroidia bacterium]
MKKTIKISWMFLLAAISSFAQTTEKVSTEIAVELQKMNIVYVGVDNPVHIAGNIKSSNFLVKAEGCEATVTGVNGDYIIRTNTNGEVTLTIK